MYTVQGQEKPSLTLMLGCVCSLVNYGIFHCPAEYCCCINIKSHCNIFTQLIPVQ